MGAHGIERIESIVVAEDWDAGEMGCGDLVLALRLPMDRLGARATLKLIARDPGAKEDLPAWCPDRPQAACAFASGLLDSTKGMIMAGKFCVSLSYAKDNCVKATVAFVIANAALGSEKETIVFLVTEAVRLSQRGYADDIHEEGFAPLRELMANFTAAGGKILLSRRASNAASSTTAISSPGPRSSAAQNSSSFSRTGVLACRSEIGTGMELRVPPRTLGGGPLVGRPCHSIAIRNPLSLHPPSLPLSLATQEVVMPHVPQHLHALTWRLTVGRSTVAVVCCCRFAGTSILCRAADCSRSARRSRRSPRTCRLGAA